MKGGTGVKKDLIIRIRKGLFDIGGPSAHSGALSQGLKFIFIPAGKNGVNRDYFIGGNLNTSLLPDGANRANQMLIGSHASSDAVHNDS
jgi:hypothetical protein